MLLLTVVLKDREMPIQLFESLADVKAFLFDNPLNGQDRPTDTVLAVVRGMKVYYDWDRHKQGLPGWDCRGFRVYEFTPRELCTGQIVSTVLSRVVD